MLVNAVMANLTTMPATCPADKGVQAQIKCVCLYADFCPCCAHSLDLVGSCAVELCSEAASLFSFIKKSTHVTVHPSHCGKDN